MNSRRWSKHNAVLRTGNGINRDRHIRKGPRKPAVRPHETEEEAVIRRFQDAQRMARFRAKRKKALEEARAAEINRFAQITAICELTRRNIAFHIANTVIANTESKDLISYLPIENSTISVRSTPGETKYSQLLTIIEELGKDIKLTYAGNRISTERVKIGIARATVLVKDCLMEIRVNL
ncbi:hypothetical protein KM043_011777 [Ampulex compressa]|nr:hypothetical protein KM043_011777 [Ampulex compressa]